VIARHIGPRGWLLLNSAEFSDEVALARSFLRASF
jgi:hypothetical protein